MTSNKKSAIKVFIVLFLFSYIVINWNSVSWIFNYKEMQGLAYDFFNPYPNSMFASADTMGDDNSLLNNSLTIPSIGLFTPVVVADSIDKTVLEDSLDRGAVYYPGSVLPGQNGQIVILGHSAPPNWPYVKHDWIFSNAQKLNVSDKITLKFNGAEYTYSVIKKEIIQKGQSLGFNELSKTNNILTLVSCWPPGENYQRIAVTAQLVK